MMVALFLETISIVAIVPVVVTVTVVPVIPFELMIVAIKSVVIAVKPMVVAIVIIVVAAMVAIMTELARGENRAAGNYQTRRLILLSQEQSRSGNSKTDCRVALALFAGLCRDRRANRSESHHTGECDGGQAM
ncbi:MAG: hypothetical protein JWN14_4287 [Chthonomonadales bacterium]|nr:hypothetical protein [Chthonomonadales bacterium]